MPGYYGGNFYGNVCLLLGTLKRGVQHRAPAVSLPCSKVGLELAKSLRNLGVLTDFEVVQRGAKGFAPVWPQNHEPSSSGEMAGYPGLYLRLLLSFQRHKPLFTPPGDLGPLVTPAGYKAAVPDSVTLLAKPTKQRHVTVQELTSARRHRTPGIFFLSTRHGLLTDIEAELRGVGGILLAHIGLPLSHVYAVRGALRSKHMVELAAENRVQGQAERAVAAARTAAAGGDRRAAARAGRRIAQAAVALEGQRAARVPLADWPIANHIESVIMPRLTQDEGAREQASVLVGQIEEGEAAEAAEVAKMRAEVLKLRLEEVAWKLRDRVERGGDGDRGGRGDRLPGPRQFGGGGRGFGRGERPRGRY